MEEEKKGPNDGSYDGIYDEDEEKGEKKDKLYKEEMEKLKKAGEEMKEREEEKLERVEKNKKEREELREKKEVEIGGQKVEPKKIYSHKREEGIFIKGKAVNYSQKIDKALRRKVHGVSLKKKKEIAEIIKNCASRKTSITGKEVDDILSKLKYGKYTGSGSSGIKRMLEKKGGEGVDLNSYKRELKRKFSRRDIDKVKRALKGGKDPLKHEMKSNPNRTSSTSRPGPSSSTSRNRF
jgi:hypothetical protein